MQSSEAEELKVEAGLPKTKGKANWRRRILVGVVDHGTGTKAAIPAVA